MKTLIVQYTPRGDLSNTKKILDAFIRKARNVEVLDLTVDRPDMLMPENLNSIFKKNWMGKELTQDEAKHVAKIYSMTDQLISADHVVVAFPTYNYSVPAAVKAWLDSVIINNQTFVLTDKGYVGKLKGKGLVINTAGGVFTGEMAKNEHAVSLAKGDLEFMGLTVETVTAHGLNMLPNPEKIVENAMKDAEAVAARWYK
ncbi:MAG: hypothetical protein HGA85_04105 [Nanoarchaeota archaeon]|nr:hypothetical protein [Nanoarchaeota archaeon]